jgi:opacity protein-like surface antigen
VGAGIEWAFALNWSAKVEYNYLGLDDPAGSPFLPGDTFTQSNRNVQMALLIGEASNRIGDTLAGRAEAALEQ